MDKLIAILENYTEADEICENSRFAKDLGLSSFDIVCIVSDINKSCNVNISAQDFVKYKTVGEMAKFVECK